ncbi:MAG: stage II sporulation protein M [Clostridia bacterium]|nr:stage II sporulation protein M [Clostridia bacterium]
MQAVREFVNKNKGIFIAALSLFAAGIVLGTIVACSLGAADSASLKEQLGKYISVTAAGSVTFGDLLTSRCADNFRYMLVMVLCAQNVYLLPAGAVCLGIKGYQLGFAISFVCGNFGTDGIAMSVVTSLFSYAVVMPFYMLAFAIAAVYAAKRRNARSGQKGELAALCAVLAVIYGVLCLAACAEAFLVPLFVGFFSV